MPQNQQTFALGLAPGGAITSGATESVYVNVPHILSILNRKKYHAVDLKGNVIDYAVQIEVRNMLNATTLLKTASLGYPTYNAVKAWHFARKQAYADSGISLRELGNGANLRPRLDSVMGTMQATISSSASAGQLVPIIDDTACSAEEAGEWDFSEMFAVPPAASSSGSNTIAEDEIVDRYDLFLCGDHTSETDGDVYRWGGVGMIQAWLEDRKGGWRAPDAEEVVQPVSPLAFARAQSTISHEVVEEAADLAKESRPYQTDDDDNAEALYAHRTLQGHIESAFPTQSTQTQAVVAPCGLLSLQITNNHADTSGVPYISVNVLAMS